MHIYIMHTMAASVIIYLSFFFFLNYHGHFVSLVLAFVFGLCGGSERVNVMEEKRKRSRRRAVQQHHVIIETFGNGSH